MKYAFHQQGYTLIEMLTVIAIIGIIFPVLFSTISALYDSHATTLSRAMALVETTKGVKEVVRDVRSATYADNGSLPIAEIATSTFTFYSDTDFDGDVERIRYFLNGTVIHKGIINPTATTSYPTSDEIVSELVKGVQNGVDGTSVFRYYDAVGGEITTNANALNVRRVEVNIIGSSRFGGETSEVSMRSSASIRNLKDIY